MKQIKKLSLSNVVGKLTRNEMRYVLAGSGGTGCKPACTIVTSSTQCCSKMVVSGDYPPCGGDRGMVCL